MEGDVTFTYSIFGSNLGLKRISPKSGSTSCGLKIFSAV